MTDAVTTTKIGLVSRNLLIESADPLLNLPDKVVDYPLAAQIRMELL